MSRGLLLGVSGRVQRLQDSPPDSVGWLSALQDVWSAALLAERHGTSVTSIDVGLPMQPQQARGTAGYAL